MDKTWRPVTAGILDIVAGVWVLCWVFLLALGGGITSIISGVPQWVPALLFGLAIPFALLALLAVIGGIFAIQRKAWGFALAGSISAFFCCFVLGTISIILVAISRNEFK
jgi:hypothetical protein